MNILFTVVFGFHANLPTRYGPPVMKQNSDTLTIQGNSLRTWSYYSPGIENAQISLSTEGRPLNAEVELWNGPDNTPFKMRIYLENGKMSPFNTVVEMPYNPNTISIKNSGTIELPIIANIITDFVDKPSDKSLTSLASIQGGAIRTYTINPNIENVEILVKTDGCPLNSRIELLQGPENNKQVVEFYTEDGFSRPFFCILNTENVESVIRIINTSPVTFPLKASVVPVI